PRASGVPAADRGQCSALLVRLLLGGMAGQGEEDVVERGAAQPDVVDLDTRRVQLADYLGEQLGAAGHGDGDPAGVPVDREGLLVRKAGNAVALEDLRGRADQGG